MKLETIREAAQATPTVAVGGLTLLGYPLSDLTLIAGFLWTIFLLIDKFPTVVQRFVALFHLAKGVIKRDTEKRD